MSAKPGYIFQSARLGFRNWNDSDTEKLFSINSDPVVMKYFPSIATRIQTEEFIDRMRKSFSEKGFCYFAVDTIGDGNFIGFTGLMEQTYEADFTPCIDIGWRLRQDAWDRGYATEGATRCLSYAFDVIKLDTVYATAPIVNIKSENVMQKIGMKKIKEFIHPRLAEHAHLRNCVLYQINAPGI